MLIYKYYLVVLYYIIFIRNSMELNMENMEKIVGGTDINITTCPYLITLQTSIHVCGGAIIHPRVIMTAAHCVTNYKNEKVIDFSRYRVYAGTSDSEDLTSAQMSKIKAIIIHPEWDIDFSLNDIAIILLISEFKFNAYIQPLSLAEPYLFRDREPVEYFSKTDCIVSGWGFIKEDIRQSSKHLKSVVLPLIENELCEDYVPGLLTDNQLCTLDPNSKKDACQGDSGGPLVCKGMGVGIVSWGLGCARPNSPGIWTRVDKYYNWITGIVNQTDIEEYARTTSRGQKNNTQRFVNIFYILCYYYFNLFKL